MASYRVAAKIESMLAYPTYTRSKNNRVLAGVAGGLAAHLNVDVLYVRLAFVVMCVFSGMGVFAYAGLWLFSQVDDNIEVPAQAKANHKVPGWALVLLGIVVTATSSISIAGIPVGLVTAFFIAGLGVYFVWSGFDASSHARTLSVIGGAILVFIGVISGLAFGSSPQDFLTSLVAIVVTLAGVGVFALPIAVRVRDSLAAKAAAEEREVIASRLHDSVLQTLALIQKRSHDNEEVIRLARAQERELRAWLFDSSQKFPEMSTFNAVELASGEVEDLFGVRIVPVTVGEDLPLNATRHALVMAAREAMVNAAKHAGVDSVDVFAETSVDPAGLEIYIRDRGCGFDTRAIPEDRHGIRDSISARVERAGGSVEIESAPGEGTEIIIKGIS